MKSNLPFTAALQKLSHPLTLAALGLVVFNDLILRVFWPSWWSGKLSDLAIIFLLPLLLTTLLAPLSGQRKHLSAGLAFGSVLVMFVLLKASPLTNHWLTAWLPIRAVPDPSDLLVLPAWGAALALWLTPASAPKMSVSRWRLLLLPLAALVTLADAAAPTYGIECLTVEDKALRSHIMYSVLESTDGGAKWEVLSGVNGELCVHKTVGESFELTSAKGIHFRGTLGEKVERSSDGQTWQTVYTSDLLSEAEQTFLEKTITSNFFYQPGPLDALVDPVSGNLVLAMGLEGVLVVPGEGRAFWAAAGPYHHSALVNGGSSAYLTLLAGEIGLVVGAALLWLVTAALRFRSSLWMIILTVLGWVFIAGEGFALTPSLANSSYTGLFSVAAIIFTSLWVLGLLIATIVRQLRRIRPILMRLPFVLLIAPILILPYLLWAMNVIPSYWMAQAAAGGVALITIVVGLLLGPRQA
jgi:hypothetical protein